MVWIRFHLLLLLAGMFIQGMDLSNDTTKIYLFPGQGSDYRIFKNIVWKDNYIPIPMHYPIPDENETLHTYAIRFIPLIDTTSDFVLVGVSLGGIYSYRPFTWGNDLYRAFRYPAS